MASVTQNAQQRRMEMHVPTSSAWRDDTGALIRGELDRPTVTVWLDEPWIAVITIGAQDGALVIEAVEFRLKPAELDKSQAGVRAVPLPRLPSGGLSLRAMRSLTFGAALDFARQCLAQTGDYVLARHGFSRSTLDAPRRPGKKGRSDHYYAEIAVAYMRAVERGSRRPAVDVAREMGDTYTAAYVRSALHTARNRGLLTAQRRGAAGGSLTSRGRAILSEAAD